MAAIDKYTFICFDFIIFFDYKILYIDFWDCQLGFLQFHFQNNSVLGCYILGFVKNVVVEIERFLPMQLSSTVIFLTIFLSFKSQKKI